MQRKLSGYKFPVYTVEFCPRNETEWLERSSIFNCTGEDSTYACFPNDEITELIEFCYPLQIIAIPPGKRNCKLGFHSGLMYKVCRKNRKFYLISSFRYSHT